MCVETGTDRNQQWFRFYPGETPDLQHITSEHLFANGPIVLSVRWTGCGGVRLGVDAPAEIAVKRGEVLRQQAS